MKAELKSIMLVRAGGMVDECGIEIVVDSWDEADRALAQMSQSVRREFGADEVDFWLYFTNGTEYKGTYDMVHWSRELPSLLGHVQAFVQTYAGLVKPDWMDEDSWMEHRSTRINDGTELAYRQFVNEHQIGVEVSA